MPLWGNNFWFEFLWFKSHIFPRDKHELEWRFRRKWENILHILKLEAQTITFIKFDHNDYVQRINE